MYEVISFSNDFLSKGIVFDITFDSNQHTYLLTAESVFDLGSDLVRERRAVICL